MKRPDYDCGELDVVLLLSAYGLEHYLAHHAPKAHPPVKRNRHRIHRRRS